MNDEMNILPQKKFLILNKTGRSNMTRVRSTEILDSTDTDVHRDQQIT